MSSSISAPLFSAIFWNFPCCRSKVVKYWFIVSILMAILYSENYILPISHDEVVHGKHSMIDKLPGEYEQKFSNLRTFYAYMYAHPGKKLLFMGNEFAQFIEWRYYEQLDWLLLNYEKHSLFKNYMKKLNWIYRLESPFWELDDSWEGFQWINADDADQNCLSFIRKDKQGNSVICIFNFAPVGHPSYRLGVPNIGTYDVILDTDDVLYGGSRRVSLKEYRSENIEYNGFNQSIDVDLAPMSALYIKVPKKQ